MNKNQKNLSARVSALETQVDTISNDVAGMRQDVRAVLEALTGRQAVAVEAPRVVGEVIEGSRKAKPAKKAKKVTKAVAAPKWGTTVEGKRCLTSKNREAFIADHAWAQPRMSTKDLAEAVLLDGKALTGVWAIGPRRTEVVLGAKAQVTQVVAHVEPTAPAKRTVTEAERARRDAPRRADGTATPKREWKLREALAETGKFDRFEIDAKVAEAYDNPALAEAFSLV